MISSRSDVQPFNPNDHESLGELLGGMVMSFLCSMLWHAISDWIYLASKQTFSLGRIASPAQTEWIFVLVSNKTRYVSVYSVIDLLINWDIIVVRGNRAVRRLHLSDSTYVKYDLQ